MSGFNPQPKPEKQPKKAKKPLKRTAVKAKKPADYYLWEAFSLYIRLRDSDENGIVKCCTCGSYARWKGDGMQAGHGISRNHWGVRYNERNVHAQCSGCNGPIGKGRPAEYAQFVNKKYGPDTWDILQASRDGKKYTAGEIKILTTYYTQQYKKLAKEKGLTI